MVNDTNDGQILRVDDLVGNKKKGIVGYLKISRSSLYGMMDPKSKSYDSTFPCSIRLTAKSVGWHKAEIDDWLASRPAGQGKRVSRAKATVIASDDAPQKRNRKSTEAKHPLVADNVQPNLKAVQKKLVTENRDSHSLRDDLAAGQAIASIGNPPCSFAR